MKELLSRAILSAVVLVVTLFGSGGYAAAACPGGNTSKGQVLSGLGETGNGCNASGVDNIVNEIVNIMSIVVGGLAVILIILAGFKYITSGGDANKVGNAKSTLVYALIGVAVAASAQVLVHFVLFQTNQAVG